ncbi:lysophospholipid acyltransferase family protein [Thermogemmatispora sp.]|uniref:lysophospholipid acyltransferase family protein n=1 Tax=Thermogemmatispora sp. TaxID=1968838 RepID=UPI001D654FE2|nr:lysophospholipid acyltransferase family protein [Thermogemmatispora sp.]MBX5450714.1 1-acyl-sn-glycerol-3-phosphate acyltransferase [Thermogemmatispora sp.]
MKQEVSLSSAGQEQPESRQPLPRPASSRRTKDLYQPYETPTLIYEILRILAVLLLAVIARMRPRGRHHIPRQGPYIVAANHLAWTDIPLIPIYLPQKVVYMAKEEVFQGRLRWLARFLGAFPVRRGEGDRQALRAAETILKAGRVLVIFPEGTRSRTRTLARAHAGLGMIALRSGVPVLPVAIWGSEDLFKKFRPEIHIVYGEPLLFKPQGPKITREEIEEATERVMRSIAALLPPSYRGVYAEAPSQPPEASTAAANESAASAEERP